MLGGVGWVNLIIMQKEWDINKHRDVLINQKHSVLKEKELPTSAEAPNNKLSWK